MCFFNTYMYYLKNIGQYGIPYWLLQKKFQKVQKMNSIWSQYLTHKGNFYQKFMCFINTFMWKKKKNSIWTQYAYIGFILTIWLILRLRCFINTLDNILTHQCVILCVKITHWVNMLTHICVSTQYEKKNSIWPQKLKASHTLR